MPPSANAGPDQIVTMPNSVVLAGTVNDDDQPDPPGAVTATWSQMSGPGTVTFANANASNTTASFSASGTYVLRMTANDGQLTASDDLTVNVFQGGGNPETVRDEFDNESYTGNNGTQNWTGSWNEEGDNDNDSSGIIQANDSAYCADPYCLRFGKNSVSWDNATISREANLSGANTATLTFSYRRRKNDEDGNAAVTLQVSSNGGGSWTNLQTYIVDVRDPDDVPQSFDISAYIASNTQIRFLGSGEADEDTVRIYFDNIQIEFDQ